MASFEVVTFLDPAEGWRYGFPKMFFPREGQTVDEWLLQEGYPAALIAKQQPYRTWEQIVDTVKIQAEQMRQWDL
jgi:hypothetical protein